MFERGLEGLQLICISLGIATEFRERRGGGIKLTRVTYTGGPSARVLSIYHLEQQN